MWLLIEVWVLIEEIRKYKHWLKDTLLYVPFLVYVSHEKQQLLNISRNELVAHINQIKFKNHEKTLQKQT